MTQHRYVDTFRNWVRLNENNEDEQQVNDRSDALTREFEEAVSQGQLKTSDLMIWFHGMMDLYDNSALKGLLFKKMKPVWAKHFRSIYPLLSMDNRELTKHDIMEIKRYKQLSNDEARHEKSADDLLKELGLL
jgi:hypothetical protein